MVNSNFRGGMDDMFPGDDHTSAGMTTQALHSRLIAGLDLSRIGTMTEDEIRTEIREAAGELCSRSSSLLTSSDRERLVNEVMDEAFGLGPLEPLLRDPTISDILVNGPRTV